MLLLAANPDLHGKAVLVLFIGGMCLFTAVIGFFFDETLTSGGGLTGRGIDMNSRDKNPEAFDRGILVAFILGVILAGAGAYGCWKF